MTRYKNGINKVTDIFMGILPALPLIILILIQPDLGTSLIIVTAYFVMIFLYEADMKSLLVIAFIALDIHISCI